MRISKIDPGQTGVEAGEAVYRVTLWRRQHSPPGLDVCQDLLGFETRTYEITGAVDVRAVIDWADRHAGADWMYTLAAIVPCDKGRVRLHLAGLDLPTGGATDSASTADVPSQRRR